MTKIEEFRNNVFCRNQSNQHKARTLWNNEISNIISDIDKTFFEIEWSHYILGHIDREVFSIFFNEYIQIHFD